MFNYPKYPEKKAGAPAQQRPNAWRAVSVVATEKCCQAAKECVGKRYLTAEVPRLPLQGCTQTHCECKYRHYNDRRVKPRRSSERGGFAKQRVAIDRRATPCRRSAET